MTLTVALSIALWFLTIELLALLSLRPLTYIFTPFIGACLSRPFGLLLFTVLVWHLNSIHIIDATPQTLRLILLAIAPALLWARRRGESFQALFLWVPTVVGFLILRSLEPAIYGGEKTMDFSFLNYFVRLETLPPEDPWAARHPMSYYYLGYYLFSLLHKISGLDTRYGYNVAVATVAALLVTSLTGAIASLLPAANKKAVIVAGLAIALMSNPEVIRLLLDGRPPSFDTFWESSRVFTGDNFSEYLVWSLLFGDLHPHLMVLPFTVLALTLLFRLFTAPPSLLLSVLFGSAWGTLLPLNAWDFITVSLLVGTFTIYNRRFVHLSLAGIVALLTTYPFLTTREGIEWGFVSISETNSVGMVLRMLGGWFAVLTLPLLAGFRKTPHLSPLPLLPLVIVILVVGEIPPLGILSLCVAVILLTSADKTLPSLLISFSASVIVVVELFYLIDRTNTVFKIYLHLWLLLGIASSVLFLRWFSELRGEQRRWAIRFIALPALWCGAGTVISVAVVAKSEWVEGPRFTLDGMAYLASINPGEAEVVTYLREKVKGTPVILEAWGGPYGPYTRITQNTGLPTLLGWEIHVGQRGVPKNEIEARKSAIHQIYTNSSVQSALTLLKSYHVEYIVVGGIERERYGGPGLAKFELPQFEKVYESGSTSLYRVTFGEQDLQLPPGSAQLILP